MRFKRALVALIFFGLLAMIGLFWRKKPTAIISPERPLEKYSFEALRKRTFLGSEIKLEKIIEQQPEFTSWLFSYYSDGKKVTGMANIPNPEKKYPVIIMLRGYADDNIYFTGLGTRKAAAVFAQNGFITLAPDFLGFGGSDAASSDILEARFSKPVEVLNLLAAVSSLPLADSSRINLWGHSNGGQIALSVLEISQRSYPTSLWAPVTRGFPESVLDFVGELDDKGLKVKKAVDDFCLIYDTKKYSINNYWADINAPIQIHQGLADALIRPEWINQMIAELKKLDKKFTLWQYSWTDHNLKQSWDEVVNRDLQFFQKF